MFAKTGVLNFKLGEKYADTLIRDVQIWRDVDTAQENTKITTFKGSFLCYIDMKKLPVWISHSSTISTCLTCSATAKSYFSVKLKRLRRGIVVELTEPLACKYVILYRHESRVECLEVELSVKKALDGAIAKMQSTAAVSTKDNNIDAILRQSQEKHLIHTKRIKKSMEISEKRLQFNETLSKLILGGLRLRGIPNSQSGFQKLYQMTFAAAEFTHRNELQQLPRTNALDVPFESLQSTVEALLKLFTKS